MRKFILTILCLGFVFGLAGCRQKEEAALTTTLEIGKNSIKTTVVEAFTEENYDLDELETMTRQEIEKLEGGGVTLEDIFLKDGKVTMVMTYADAGSYQRFNNQFLYVGPVEEAVSAGYDSDITLTDVNDSSRTVSRNALNSVSDDHIMILEDAWRVKVNGTISYISENVTAIDQNTADVTGDGISVIVFN